MFIEDEELSLSEIGVEGESRLQSQDSAFRNVRLIIWPTDDDSSGCF